MTIFIVRFGIYWFTERISIEQSFSSQYMHTYVYDGGVFPLWKRLDDVCNVTSELKKERVREAKEFIKEHKRLKAL